jgi:single-strand DNA-binding protein
MINKVTLVGRLGKDPETKYMSSGDCVCNFSIATSESWKDKQTGEKKERSEWHRITAWRKLGEICGKYLKKGSLVYLEGKIQTRTWEKDGQTQYSTEIVAENMKMLNGGEKQERRPRAPKSSGPGEYQYPQPEPGEDDSDIPF